jgi:hypothetical protein
LWFRLLVGVLALLPALATAQEGEAEDEVKIADNSFLVEEAYNQEAGIVQHIFNFVPSWERGPNARRNFDVLFTQEWPVFSQRHQLSYAVPLRRFDESPPAGGGAEGGGLGDILLSYRYQLSNGEDGRLPFACAPRASLIFPSGDVEKGLGDGKLGYQFNLPISKEFARWAFHFNAGLTKIPGSRAGVDPLVSFAGRDLDGYNLGASAIYFLKPNFHLMLETVALWDDELEADGAERHLFQSVVSPGFRWAPYTEGDTQWVLGMGLPIGISSDAPDIGIIFYMSFEHRFLKTAR